MPEERSFLQWTPLLTPKDIYSDFVSLGSPIYANNSLYWLEGRPSEQGRQIIVIRDDQGKIADLTPQEYYVRTRVHEYGGRAFTIGETYCYFVNFKDQRIYRQDLSNPTHIVPLTPEINSDTSIGKYAALKITPDQNFLLFIYEQEYKDKENVNTVAMLPLPASAPVHEPTILVHGNNFYGEPNISKDGKKLVWLTWNHPNMPWDATELWIADLGSSSVHNAKKLIGGQGISICSPMFTPDGDILFVMDEANKQTTDPKNWWNWYRYSINSGTIEPVTTVTNKEFGLPMWVLGNAEYGIIKKNLICLYTNEGIHHLVSIDLVTKKITELQLPFIAFSSNFGIDPSDNIYIVAAGRTESPALI